VGADIRRMPLPDNLRLIPRQRQGRESDIGTAKLGTGTFFTYEKRADFHGNSEKECLSLQHHAPPNAALIFVTFVPVPNFALTLPLPWIYSHVLGGKASEWYKEMHHSGSNFQLSIRGAFHGTE
jgi:hypothetical protein